MADESKHGEVRFAASARLQRLFGRDLMPDYESAIEELVKNAYDSNASEVVVTIVRATDHHPGEIEIRDNGVGLSLREFKRVWMFAGYSEKTGQPLAGTGRIQVGEKGIGRFAADKLGRKLTVVTKPKGAREALKVLFEWKRFENKRRLLSDIAIPYEHIDEPLLPRDQSGTILRIEELNCDWDDRAIEGLRRRLARLLNPYDEGQRFQISLVAPRRRLSGRVVPQELSGAEFEWEIARSAQGTIQIKRRVRQDTDVAAWYEWEAVPLVYERAVTEREEFGPLRARFLYFVERPKKAQVADAAPGVSVYRDGLRVEPAGSAEADWLGLLAKRAKRAGHMPLVPSRLFGFVEISREENPELRDATNRRTFIDAPALSAFRLFLQDRLREVEGEVEREVAKPRWEKSKQVKSQKFLQARYRTVSIMSLSLAHELRQPLQSIQTASENIADATEAAGLADADVNQSLEVIRRSVRRMDRQIQFLRNLGSGRQELDKFSVNEAIDEVLGVFSEFARARGIVLDQPKGPSVDVVFNQATLLATLTNLVLNACQAIGEAGDGRQHEVRVFGGETERGIDIRVEDDGPGVAEANRARLFKRQTTTKQGGMGIGLIVWREALEMFGGTLECEKFSDPTTFLIRIPRSGGGG